MWVKIANFSDALSKIVGALLILLGVLTAVVPIIGAYANGVFAWRFGANGVLKYELGDDTSGERKPTANVGDLYLLRSGPREYLDLKWGDVLQAKSTNYFREDNGCGKTKNCSKSPRVFELLKGECAIVLWKVYEDNGADNQQFKNRQGGWVRVATTSCGLFD